MSGVSDSVLEALVRALQLDEAERAHLFDLAGAAKPTSAQRRRRARRQRLRPSVQHILDGITGAAAIVHNARLDNLAANQLGYAFYADWDRAASDVAAILRFAAGRDPYDRDLSDLVGELATQSAAFRTRWASHNVRFHNAGVKRFNHPVVGELDLSFNRLDLAADPGLTLFTYTAEPRSPSEDALKLLGSWAATVDGAESARSMDQR